MKRFKTLSLLLISLSFFACSATTADSAASKNRIEKNIVFSQIREKWQLESIDGTPISPEINSTLEVDAQGRATGQLACNNFFGKLELKDNRLKIDPMGSTRMRCSGVMNQVERILSSVLNDWSEIQITDNRLSLSGKKHSLSYRTDR